MMNTHEQQFVGREVELNKIRRCIEQPGRTYVVAIHGLGGMGKTRLMRRVFQEQLGRLRCLEIVDFSQSKTRKKAWLMDEIARQATDGFDRYQKSRRETSERAHVEPLLLVDQQEQAEVFLTDFEAWESRHGQRSLFFFDTLELVQDTEVLEFIMQLAQYAQNAVFLLAGRRNDQFRDSWREKLPPGFLEFVRLEGFDEPDALAYIQARPAGAMLAEDEQRTLFLLSENGIPLKLALALDWLSRGFILPSLAHYSCQDLVDLRRRSAEDFHRVLLNFERELVMLIAQLSRDADRALHIMAHVYLRFNRELLHLLLPDIDVDKVVAELQTRPFSDYVKFIEDDYFVLHDEIQRMIVQHIWDSERDQNHEERRRLSQQVVDWYDTKLSDIKKQDHGSDDEEGWIYRIEKLHYELDVSLVHGYHQFAPLCEELLDRRESELAALASDILLKDQPLREELHRFADTYYRAWIMVRRDQFQEARDRIMRALPRLEVAQGPTLGTVEEQRFLDQEVTQRLGDVYILLGYCNRKLGDWTSAIAYYERGRDWTRQRLDKLLCDVPQDPEQVRRAQSRLAEILNDMANLQRMRGQLDEARRHCKTSLLIREKLVEPRAIGHCCYVMSMIMWESGNTAEAVGYLSRARRQYQKSKLESLERAWVDRFDGYVMLRTGNRLGALSLLTRARDEIAKGTSGLEDEHAQVLLHLSRLHRKDSSPDFDLAIREAESALSIARKIRDDYRITDCCLTIAQALWRAVLVAEAQEGSVRSSMGSDGGDRFRIDPYIQEGLAIAQRRGYRRLQALLVDLQAEMVYHRSSFAEAFRLYTSACILSADLKPSTFARALSRLSEHLYQRAEREPDHVASLCNQIILEWNKDPQRDASHPEFRSEIQEHIGRVAADMCRRRDLERKLEVELSRGSWQVAEQYCDDIDNIPNHASIERAKSLQRRAEACFGGNDFTFARLYAQRAARIWQEHDDCSTELAESYLLLSRIYWQLGNTEWAAERIQKAGQLCEAAKWDLGRCRVALERGYFYFRTYQFELANQWLEEALGLARQLNDPVLLANTLNVMSRVARLDPAYQEQPEVGFAQAHSRATEGLEILRDQDWLAAAELYLTLCILHYRWSKYCSGKGEESHGRDHLEKAKEYHLLGWNKISEMASPMLHSIYRGMQGNIALESGDVELARFYFLAELQYATKTKHMRLLRAVDLLENWLVAQPPDTAREHATWLMTEWCNRGFSTSHPQVNQALEWLIEYRTYIPGHSQVG